MELVNDGEVPIVLRPGMRIAQLVFFDTGKEADYRDPTTKAVEGIKYDCPTGPEFSKIHKDKETGFWSLFDEIQLNADSAFRNANGTLAG